MLKRITRLLQPAIPSESDEPIMREALACHQAGNTTEAEAGYRKLLSTDPAHAPATHFLGMLNCQAGNNEQGIELILRSIRLKPNTPAFHANLGAVYGLLGRHDAAASALADAVRLGPQVWEARMNLAVALEHCGKKSEALSHYVEAQGLAPDPQSESGIRARSEIARGLSRIGQFDRAIAVQKELVKHSSDTEVLETLCRYQELVGDLQGCIASQRRLVDMQPGSAKAHSALLYSMLHDPAQSQQSLFKAHLQWADRHTASIPTSEVFRPISHDHSKNRRLRIGYLSPNFYATPIPRSIEPMLDAHDRTQFDITCYCDSRINDQTTRRMRSKADHWRDTHGLSDIQLCEAVRDDKIDILIELTGHMAGNRMLAMARRPAPLQATYLYPHTTGLKQIDFRLTDPWIDPPGAKGFSSETIARVGPTTWCYRPPDTSVPINALPATAKGYITFGSFNRLLKINPGVLSAMADILRLVPKSRLLLLVEQAERGDWMRNQFEQMGIQRDRIETPVRRAHDDFLRLCHQTDIALDSFPYNGQTTSYDLLWMGLPFVTLAGRPQMSRVGLDLLANMNVLELVACTPQRYIEIAVALARDIPRLRRLRADLRERMRYSPIMDEMGLTRRIEQIYLDAWTRLPE